MSGLTPELVDKLDKALAEIVTAGATCDPAAILMAHGVGIVDRDRHRSLVDERVYEGALLRGQRWQRLAVAYLAPREPTAAVWREISRGMACPTG